ncbi:Coenzyme F420 hydrogenase/dehydrogenase, beta subunit C-terminal domain [Pseudonocardia sp. RS010]|uniref:Coenzyme F420 hydrogenase/dehydrogenase, beta subunit C-terminal domain n=1 Tax=Pseudonocardia sp. RS010 TaxID=3385979 RepID=UPI0039A1B720
MRLSAEGFLRPSSRQSAKPPELRGSAERAVFAEVCPGLSVLRPERSAEHKFDKYFGAYLAVWRAWSSDDALRLAGSSGGVISAITSYLVETGEDRYVVSTAPEDGDPTRAAPTVARSADSVMASAGSRYAPVATLGSFSRATYESSAAIVAKPCEASAARALGIKSPVVISFFCAGVPSQDATTRLVERLGARVGAIAQLWYRGHGWPGCFTVKESSGRESRMTYRESWGEHLGPTMQWRCKVCVDGVGEAADLSVGDLWETDKDGYPLFEERPGVSALIARTPRGLTLVQELVARGVLSAEEIGVDELYPVQPHQVGRRSTLPGRLIGAHLGGRKVPSYPGYGLPSLFWEKPLRNIRALLGSLIRARRSADNSPET